MSDFLEDSPPNDAGRDAATDAGALSALVRLRRVAASNEPLGEFVEFGVWQGAFRDVGGIGAGGEDAAPISDEHVAQRLIADFDRADLVRLLHPIARLYERLAGA